MPYAARLKTARIAAGFKSARAAALALGVPVATYAQHERRHRTMNVQTFDRYMTFFEGPTTDDEPR